MTNNDEKEPRETSTKNDNEIQEQKTATKN